MNNPASVDISDPTNNNSLKNHNIDDHNIDDVLISNDSTSTSSVLVLSVTDFDTSLTNSTTTNVIGQTNSETSS
ncbi:6482_t:CDS:2 [Racocetra fulgida]|uniref:6482_t:CDS:1 n=1 Tax=Racocetra fulgida TaxID=60492 RepID=A0A9N9BDX3_9GLOM|nr:6482_t:CDS:2 [Racocetra fulgida]